jgi:hypothetical protein
MVQPKEAKVLVLKPKNKPRKYDSRLSIFSHLVILFAVALNALCQGETFVPSKFFAAQGLPATSLAASVNLTLRRTSARRDAATCDSDRCCALDHFCSSLSFSCAPCALCEYDGDSVGFSCRARCGQPDAPGAGGGMWRGDRTAPRLLWLSLTPGAVDAAEERQLVELRFAVQVRRLDARSHRNIVHSSTARRTAEPPNLLNLAFPPTARARIFEKGALR